LQKLFFLNYPKSFLWSLWFSKKKSAFAAQGFSLQSGLGDCASKQKSVNKVVLMISTIYLLNLRK
jgi:hypothetical protein